MGVKVKVIYGELSAMGLYTCGCLWVKVFAVLGEILASDWGDNLKNQVCKPQQCTSLD